MTVVALLALLFPLQRLTSHQSAPLLQPPAPDSDVQKENSLELTSTTVPFEISDSYEGKPIWSGESTSPTIATDTELKFPPEGIDMVLEVSWSQARRRR